MPSGSQIRAARGLLGWSASELAERSEVTLRTIQRFETADGIPPNRSGTLDKVRAALEAQGIEFLGDPETSPGVRLRRKA
jgi:transcriptional regulator with XRE-family HTH domain